MKFSFYTDDVTKLSCGLLGILVFEEHVGDGAIFKAVDQRLDGLLGRLVGDEQFKGKKGQSLSLHTHGRVGPQRLLLVGAGARKDLQPADLRGFAARVVKAGGAVQAKEVGAVLPYLDGGATPTTAERAAQFLAEGAVLGVYKFDKYLAGDKKKPSTVEEVKIV
ncbi:MAG TPA: M17 family peptidase N-terminal domain-containing protein, partial [Polyangia bacterium]